MVSLENVSLVRNRKKPDAVDDSGSRKRKAPNEPEE
jgi:hypothetical protein